ncbi:P-loop NTPase [Methanolobus sp. ZRKC2]|uniref:ATP-binding protein n=1 Tax=Methanolobus sp. ZRKC2 TaxID=3125783 RepID=UPI003244706C
MKILLCGKGGCGKSTLTALLAQAMVRGGYNVLVVDNDESNFGLHRQLGMELPQDFLNYFGGKNELAEKMMNSFSSGEEVQFFESRWEIADIPREYVSRNGNLSLMSVGKIHDFGEGCACPMGALSKHLLKNIDTASNDFVLVDTEAGVEHFGRGVEEGCDALFMVIDPSYESIRLSEKISNLANAAGKELYFVLNRVEGGSKTILFEQVPQNRVLATLPIMESVFRAGLLGNEFNVNSPEIESIVSFLVKLKD